MATFFELIVPSAAAIETSIDFDEFSYVVAEPAQNHTHDESDKGEAIHAMLRDCGTMDAETSSARRL